MLEDTKILLLKDHAPEEKEPFHESTEVQTLGAFKYQCNCVYVYEVHIGTLPCVYSESVAKNVLVQPQRRLEKPAALH